MFTPAEIEPVFYKAMVAGYASDVKPTTIAELPNSNVIVFEEGFWKVVDIWFTPPGTPNSFGNTIIYGKDVAVWTMHYWGEYPKNDVLCVLKDVLLNEYKLRALEIKKSNQVFNGCRGPRVHNLDGAFKPYCYINMLCPNSSFANFSGREEIYSDKYTVINPRLLGWHEYHGFML
ncbi:MAG TPA: hypothetical protein VGT41_06435 [Candidatus Babeliales bacterium]|nr:hypothetical protein [Candidatus Babeliales bacterium]